ncbi:MAG: GGDEF domain-containing protein [Lachnospiraceae bacterium]|nr:GGDEF domain-containing protein [Lachnospiraceae bacterium]
MERVKELAVDFVKQGCREYFVNKSSDFIMNNCESYDIALSGFRNTDWIEQFKIISEFYHVDKLADNVYYIYAKLSLENSFKSANARDKYLIEGTFVCKYTENDTFKFSGIQISGTENFNFEERDKDSSNLIYKKVLEYSYDVIFEYDMLNNTFTYDPDKYRKLFETDTHFVSADQWFWHMVTECLHPEDSEYMDIFRSADVHKRLKNNQNVLQHEIRIKNREKGYIWLKMTIIFMTDPEKNRLTRVFVMFKDIDEEKRKDLDYITRARTDELTGLYNKEYAEHLIKRHIRQNNNGLFIIVDIDNFKSVNDMFGHITGNELLKKVANSLKNSMDPNDYSGRFGGDEFILFIKNISDIKIAKEKLATIIEKLHFTHSEEFAFKEIMCSAGGVIVGNENDYEKLLKEAGKNLSDAKKAGKYTYIITSYV